MISRTSVYLELKVNETWIAFTTESFFCTLSNCVKLSDRRRAWLPSQVSRLFFCCIGPTSDYCRRSALAKWSLTCAVLAELRCVSHTAVFVLYRSCSLVNISNGSVS